MQIKDLPDILHRAIEHKCPHCGKRHIVDLDLRPIKASYKGRDNGQEGTDQAKGTALQG